MNWTLAIVVAAIAALAVVHFTARVTRSHPDLYCYDPRQIDEFSGPVTGYCELKWRVA